jgi:hypothetical protein
MSALANLLGLLAVHVWVANIHFSQIPVILADTLKHNAKWYWKEYG